MKVIGLVLLAGGLLMLLAGQWLLAIPLEYAAYELWTWNEGDLDD